MKLRPLEWVVVRRECRRRASPIIAAAFGFVNFYQIELDGDLYYITLRESTSTGGYASLPEAKQAAEAHRLQVIKDELGVG